MEKEMKTLTGSLLAAALLALAAPALSNPSVEVVVVTAKQPAAQMLSDMTDEIVAETTADLRASQPKIAAPVVRVEVPTAPAASK
jgi:hypothetical protein